jgi:hypothetical protein
MIRTLVMSLPLAFGAVTMTTACTSASSVCQTICECEHCNKYAELSRCRSMEKAEARAEAYECGTEHAAVMACTLEKGTCDEETSNFTTAAPGTCAEVGAGMSCTVDADCFGGNATCSNNMCVERMCEGSGRSCDTNADCADDGPDRCQDEKEKLADCIENASGRND